MKKITILGAGSWGAALAKILTENGHKVCLWSALPEEIQMLRARHEHLDKLPGVKLPEEIVYSDDLRASLKDVNQVVMAVPSTYVEKTARDMNGLIMSGSLIVSVTKGLDEKSLTTMSQLIRQILPHCKVGVLSGPSHAEEVARGIPTSVVAGSRSEKIAFQVQEMFSADTLRVYRSQDVYSIELGGALKNVVALAAGITDGIGFGDNTKAALMTRGMAEIMRLGVAMGGRAQTFYGLSGIGDLIVTCSSKHSRNRKAGMLIGKGLSLDEALKEVKMVVEGVHCAKAALALGKKHKVELPIIEKTCEVLFEGKDPKEAVFELMLRDPKPEL